MQADPGGVARTSEHRGDLAGIQSFPCGEREQLAVVVAQSYERSGHPRDLLVGVRRVRRRDHVRVQATREPPAAPFAAVVVGEGVARDP